MKACYKCTSEIQDDFKFCPYCGANQLEVKCSNCSYLNEPNSKFCQECGTILKVQKETEKDNKLNVKNKEPEIELIIDPIPTFGITIEFNYSTSQTFDFALIEAEKFDSYVKFGEGKKAIHRVTIAEDQIELVGALVENMKGWRNRRVYHNGEKVLWDSIFNYKWCFDQRNKSYKPEYYCFGYENNYDFNLWGCIQSRLGFSENSELFTYGEWLNNKADWKFDKERIRHNLEKNIYQYRFCPAMNPELIKNIIDAFPEKVNPARDKNWKFVRNWRSEEGLKIITNDYGYKEENYMNGAAPANMTKFAKEISKKINSKLPIEFK